MSEDGPDMVQVERSVLVCLLMSDAALSAEFNDPAEADLQRLATEVAAGERDMLTAADWEDGE